VKFTIISLPFIETALAIRLVLPGFGKVGHPTSQSDRNNAAIDKSFSNFAKKFRGISN
jgi:hypothetical protein